MNAVIADYRRMFGAKVNIHGQDVTPKYAVLNPAGGHVSATTMTEAKHAGQMMIEAGVATGVVLDAGVEDVTVH